MKALSILSGVPLALLPGRAQSGRFASAFTRVPDTQMTGGTSG